MVAGPKLEFESRKNIFSQFQKLPSITDCLDVTCPPHVFFVASVHPCKKIVSLLWTYYVSLLIFGVPYFKRKNGTFVGSFVCLSVCSSVISLKLIKVSHRSEILS